MVINVTKEYDTSEEDVTRDNETTETLKTIDQKRLNTKNRVHDESY